MNAVVKALHMQDYDPVSRNPFLSLIGAKLVEAINGTARFTVEMTPQLENLHGFTHGGVIMTILDATLANAAISKLDSFSPVVTIDMSVSFLRPGSGSLTAVARAIGGGSSICLCEGEILDAHGRMVAKAIGSFKYRHPKKSKSAGVEQEESAQAE